jgi:RNA polymerase sigma-70 factor (ECF subfamily)
VSKPDQELIADCLNGQTHAFGDLVSRYQNRLYNTLVTVLGSRDDAHDVAQEAFIKAYRALPNFRGDSAFYTWLYRIGINTAKNYLVAMGRRAPTTTEFDSEDAENFEDGDQLRHCQDVVDLGGQVKQLQLPALVGHRRVAADDMADMVFAD